jgi:hypothetical protein
MMQSQTPGQMTWRPPGTTETILHLRLRAFDPWRPYTEFPEYVLPDPEGFSQGYATFIALMSKKWEIVPVTR